MSKTVKTHVTRIEAFVAIEGDQGKPTTMCKLSTANAPAVSFLKPSKAPELPFFRTAVGSNRGCLLRRAGQRTGGVRSAYTLWGSCGLKARIYTAIKDPVHGLPPAEANAARCARWRCCLGD
jgi:hypothetical protein